MLKAAVNQHAAEAKQHPASQILPLSQQSLTQSNRQSTLAPSTSSSINAKNPYKPPTFVGVKRTSDGLAKATAASFENEENMASSRAHFRTPAGVEVIDIDDFPDDDLEVDSPRGILPVKTPAHSGPVAYPSLPSPPARAVVNLISPTKPRQQQYQTPSFESRHDAGPPSSLPFAWSSSPSAHLEPKNASVVAAPPQPKARRVLPWKKDEDTTVTYKREPTTNSSIILDKNLKTPAAKSIALWEQTESALRGNQKKHREEARKIAKVPAEESMFQVKTKKKKERVPQVFLSDEQKHVLRLVTEAKESVFFTGSAGTGKSVLLREIIASLRRQYAKEPDRIAVTASTGLAACNVGGVTLHSFAGIGLGKEDAPELVRKIKRNQKAKHRWMRTKVLIIDEVSMVDGELFDKLEAIARQLRNNGRPFGGIQLVITGDFFQLPPVPERGVPAKFSFDAAQWPAVIKNTIGLHQVFRQKDPVFAGMLNEMREGKLSLSSIKAFQTLNREVDYKDDITATELFPLRQEVERANKLRLERLQGAPFVYEAKDGGSITDKVQRDRILGNCMAPEEITLKKGAQVMLIKNIDETLANGSIGQVIAFMTAEQFDKHSFDDELRQQNELLEALTPAATLSKEDLARKRLTENTSAVRQWPLVRFELQDGTSRDLLCQPEVWKTELPNGEIQASRSQIPLILAWALSIHKAQGQTLERVKVNLGKVFEKGQAYVALSRATSMEGLQVLNFDPRKVNAHEKVIDFYSKLARVEHLDQIKPEPKDIRRASAFEEAFMRDMTNV